MKNHELLNINQIQIHPSLDTGTVYTLQVVHGTKASPKPSTGSSTGPSIMQFPGLNCLITWERTPQPPSPLAQEPSPTVNEDNYSDDSDHEEDKEKSSSDEDSSEVKEKSKEKNESETIPSPKATSPETNDEPESKVEDEEKPTESKTDSSNEPDNEPKVEKQETEPEVEPEVKEVEVSMSSLVVEENGKFSVSQSPRESVSSTGSSQTNRSKKNDVNPDYRSPYALSDDQKKRLRKRERAKQRKLREDAEAERIQKQEAEVILSKYTGCLMKIVPRLIESGID